MPFQWQGLLAPYQLKRPQVGSFGSQMLANETNGLAFAASDASLRIKDTVTPANNYNASAITKWGNVRGVVSMCTDENGFITFGPENRLVGSTTPTNATYWTLTGATSAMDVVGPDSTTTGLTITENTANSIHNWSAAGGNRPTLLGPTICTISVYMKAGTRRYVNLEFGGAGAGAFCIVDTQTWTITNSGSGLPAAPVNYISSNITPDAAAGWYRVEMTMEVQTVGTSIAVIAGATNPLGSRSQAYVGTSSTIIVWGLQLERRPYAGPYLPTITATSNGIRRDYDPRLNGAAGFLIEESRINIAMQNRSMFVTHHVGISGGSGTFTNGETVNATGGGTGILRVELSLGTPWAIANGTGTFTGTLTGATSGATRTITSSVNVWVPTNMTVARNQIGADGLADSTCSLTATAANATCLQTMTIVSANRCHSCFIKRLVGTGVIEMTMDGIVFVPITGQVTNSWTAVEIPSQTLANPTVGIRIATSGDSVAVDFVQSEIGTFRTSPIWTLMSTVTRAADVITRPVTEFNYSAANGTFYWKFVSMNVVQESRVLSLMGANQNETVETGVNVSAAVMLKVQAGGSSQTDPLTSGTVTSFIPVYVAASWAAADFNLSVNGGTVVEDSTGVMPSAATNLHVGAGYLAAVLRYANGWIMNGMHLPRTMTPTELQNASGNFSTVTLSGSHTVMENAPYNTVVGDLGFLNTPTGTPVFSLIDNNQDRFKINGNQLRVQQGIDFEFMRDYRIVVACTGVTPPALQQEFIIVAIDVSSEAPVILLSSHTVPDDAPIGAEIATISTLNCTGTPVFSTLAPKFTISGNKLLANGTHDFSTTVFTNTTVTCTGMTPTPIMSGGATTMYIQQHATAFTDSDFSNSDFFVDGECDPIFTDSLTRQKMGFDHRNYFMDATNEEFNPASVINMSAMKSTHTTGSINTLVDNKKLTVASAVGFAVNDPIIIAVGGEQGGTIGGPTGPAGGVGDSPGLGQRKTVGVGGAFPGRSFATEQEMQDLLEYADTHPLEWPFGTYVWIHATREIWRWAPFPTDPGSGHIWVRMLHKDRYEYEYVCPVALVTKITAISGNELTLETGASISTTGADVYFDNWKIIHDAWASNPVGGGSWVSGNGVRKIIDFPAGSFAISNSFLRQQYHGWTIRGQGRDMPGGTEIFQPKGVWWLQIGYTFQFSQCSDIVLKDFSYRGNQGLHGYGMTYQVSTTFSGPVVSGGVHFNNPSYGCVIERVRVGDVMQNCFSLSYFNRAINCRSTKSQPMMHYWQWEHNAAGSRGACFEDCEADYEWYTAGWETFLGYGTHFVRCLSHNGSWSLNTSGGWKLLDCEVTMEENGAYTDNSFSHSNPIININSNIASQGGSAGEYLTTIPSEIVDLKVNMLGYSATTYRYPDRPSDGVTQLWTDVLKNIVVNVGVENVTIRGTSTDMANPSSWYRAPPFNSAVPSSLHGPMGIYSPATTILNVHVSNFECLGLTRSGWRNIEVGNGSITNCNATTIKFPLVSG